MISFLTTNKIGMNRCATRRNRRNRIGNQENVIGE